MVICSIFTFLAKREPNPDIICKKETTHFCFDAKVCRM